MSGSEKNALQEMGALLEGPAAAAPAAFERLAAFFGPAATAAAAAACSWDEAARFWRLLGETSALRASCRQVKTIGLCYFRLGIGGAERVVSFLANLWASMGYRVVLFCDEEPSEEDYEVPASVKRVQLPLFLEANAENYGRRAELLSEALRNHKVDAMVYHQWLSHALPWDMLVCKLLNVPFLLYTHGMFGCMYRWDNRWEIQLPVVAGYADGVVTLDAADARFWGEQCPRVWQTANPITLAPDAAKVSALDGGNIVWVGRLDPMQKQPAEALEVMALVVRELSDAHLTVVGPAPDDGVMEDLESTAQRLGIASNVTFVGPKKDVAPYLESSAVYLSTSCLEGWYLTLAEAMARGLPSVAYELPYLTLLQGECGCVQVPQGDRAGAAAAAVRLLKDGAERKRLGTQAFSAISRVAEFDFEGFWRGVFGQLEREPLPARNRAADTMWDIMSIANLHAIDAREGELRAAREACERAVGAEGQARRRACEVEESTTYRVGRAIMTLPCALADVLRRLRR